MGQGLLTRITTSGKVWDKILNKYMELKEFILSLTKNKLTVFIIIIIFLILALIISIIQPFKYSSSSQVLVIQDFSNPDPYLASKSTEYLSNILAKVIYSNSFFGNVLNSGYFINKNYFGQTVKSQMRSWNKTVSAKAINDSGIILLIVYHPDRDQAELINRAVVHTLQTKHGLYHGGGGNVSIKVIDEPIGSNYPVQPNLILNFGLAFTLGLVFSLIYIYLFPEEQYNIRLTPKSAVSAAVAILLENPKVNLAAAEPAEVLAQPVYVSENYNEANEVSNEADNDDYNDDYDDLDLHEEITSQGDMKNIFGQSSPDNSE